jgi:hypothetical protein
VPAEASSEKSHLRLSALLSEIKRTPAGDARCLKLIQEFDAGCAILFARFRLDPA